MKLTKEQLHQIKLNRSILSDSDSLFICLLIEQIERYHDGLKAFVDKNFQGGSKADREDYVQMVTAKDIYELKKLIYD